VSYKAILKPIVTIFQQNVIWWKLKQKILSENFPTKQIVVKQIPQVDFFWKFFHE
jgi:hypothetical protein